MAFLTTWSNLTFNSTLEEFFCLQAKMLYVMILAITIVAKFDILSCKEQVVTYSIFNNEIGLKNEQGYS
jgi:hypothetical protein